MFIKRNTGAKLDVVVALVVLATITVVAAIAWIIVGRTAAIAAAVLLFLMLDGFGCVWTLATFRMNQRIGDKLDAEDEARIRTESRNNPTIR
jgi:uncharacterized membrane protein YqjE